MNYAYPAYDGKMSRVTKCEIIAQTRDTITIKGKLWGDKYNKEHIVTFNKDDRGFSAEVSYSEEPTLMQMLDPQMKGDFYRLYFEKDYPDDYKFMIANL